MDMVAPSSGGGSRPAPTGLGEMEGGRRGTWLAVWVTAAYGMVLCVAMGQHELWRDELQAWMLARDSSGPIDLLRNMEYEASGMLWHLLLMPVTRITDSPAGMQVLHWFIACAAVYVTIRYAPLRPLHKALLPFGYFPLIEYGMMSRNYALGLLGIVVACALLRRRHQRPMTLAVVLVLASHTSALACIVAGGLVVALAAEQARWSGSGNGESGRGRTTGWASLGVAIAGIGLAVAQTAPPEDVTLSNLQATWEHSWLTSWDRWKAEAVLRTIPGVVFLPLDLRMAPVVGWHQVHPQAVYGAGMTILLAVAAVAWGPKEGVGRALLPGLGGGLLAFFYVVHYGSMRHHGFLLVALLVAAWAGRAMSGREGEGRKTVGGRVGSVLVGLLLAGHVAGAARAVAIEVVHPFSQAEETADYIEAQRLDGLPMLGYPDWSTSAVLGHLPPGKRMNYAQGEREGTYVVYDGARIGEGKEGTTGSGSLLRQLETLAERGGGKALLIMGSGTAVVPRDPRLRALASFTGAVAPDESFTLYLYESK